MKPQYSESALLSLALQHHHDLNLPDGNAHIERYVKKCCVHTLNNHVTLILPLVLLVRLHVLSVQ